VTIAAPTNLADLFSLYESHGHRTYGEDVTGLDHALQCAKLAVDDGATTELIAAALFHDVGWFLTSEGLDDDAVPMNGDHAALGARVLSPLLGPAVAQPVALHVLAKRWRCTIDPDYYDELSEASRITFIAQGGSLNTDERARFEAHPGFVTAMALRSWDDRAKVSGLDVPGLDHYRSLAEGIANSTSRSVDRLESA
jgi:predicted HD phosphohydrolase